MTSAALAVPPRHCRSPAHRDIPAGRLPLPCSSTQQGPGCTVTLSQGGRAAAAASGAEGFGFANLSPLVRLRAHAQAPNDLDPGTAPRGAASVAAAAQRDSQRSAEGSSASRGCT